MRSRFALLAAVVLLLASFSFLMSVEIPENIEGKLSIVSDDYHNATINFDVTLPGGAPADGFKVEVRNSMTPSYLDWGITDSLGNLRLYVNFMTLGICELRIYDLNGTSVHYEEFKVWPDEILDKSIEVGDSLEYVNKLHGVLRNASNNAPVPSYRINLAGTDDYGNTFGMYNVTDHLGRYSFDLLNSSSSYRLWPEYTGVYNTFNIEFFLEEGVFDHPHDLYMKPIYYPPQPTHIRVRDTRTDDLQTQGTIYISGFMDVLDNAQFSTAAVLTDPHNGWFNLSLNAGDYRAYWQPRVTYGEPFFFFDSYFYVNDTEFFHEVPVYLPEYVDLILETWNSTSPIPDVYTSWSDHNDGSPISCYAYSDPLGITRIKVPADRAVELHIDRYGHEKRIIEVDPIGSTPPIMMNITLEEEPPAVITEANVTVKVIDDITGIPIPYSQVTVTRRSEQMIQSYQLSANETGVLDTVVRTAEDGYTFTSFDFEAKNNIGKGKVSGLSLNEGQNPEIVIRVIRHEMEEPMIRTHFYVKDESGTPIPDLKLQVTMQGGSDTIWTHTVTDSNGKAELIGPPGMYNFLVHDSLKTWRNHWTLGYVEVEVTEPGLIGDITAYPTHPLDTYWGFVKSALTMSTLSNVRVFSSSFRELEETRNGPSMNGQSDRLYLFNTYLGTDLGGFYRINGRETIEVEFEKDGYFKKVIRIEQGTRADQIDDVFMEPVTEFSCWVNGTLVNERGEPINGEIIVMDRDHDDHELHYWYTNETGNFSFQMYPGNFTFWIFNDTIEDYVDVTVGPEGIDGLILSLIPTSEVMGYVMDRNGKSLSEINVTLVNHDTNETELWQLTDEFGKFSFEVPAGRYYIAIERTEKFDPYVGDVFETNGWDDETFFIFLPDRSVADIAGRVLGEEGPLEGGVPGAHLILLLDDVELQNVTTDEMGYYRFIDVEYGANYVVEAHPPNEWLPVEDIRSGYTSNRSRNITVSGVEVEANIHLPYIFIEPPQWLEIVEYYPTGENVSLNQDIIIVFSHMINISTFIEAFSVEPEIGNLSFIWNYPRDFVVVRHDDLEPNRTYEVTLSGSVRSYEGWPLKDFEGVAWNFTTGDDLTAWRMTNVDVEVESDKEVIFEVEGLGGMTIYVVIDGIGSFQMMETFPGRYGIGIGGENFQWDTTYSYYFTDVPDGEDKAPGFSGTFTTREEPSLVLMSANVTAEEDGSLRIEVMGPTNQTVWVNISEIGWYELDEVEEGIYRIIIPMENLEWNTTYYYYFSDSEDGPQLALDLAGDVTTVEEPPAGDDDDDDDDESIVYKVFKWICVGCLACCGFFLLLIFLGLILLWLAGRKKPEIGLDEE